VKTESNDSRRTRVEMVMKPTTAVKALFYATSISLAVSAVIVFGTARLMRVHSTKEFNSKMHAIISPITKRYGEYVPEPTEEDDTVFVREMEPVWDIVWGQKEEEPAAPANNNRAEQKESETT